MGQKIGHKWFLWQYQMPVARQEKTKWNKPLRISSNIIALKTGKCEFFEHDFGRFCKLVQASPYPFPSICDWCQPKVFPDPLPLTATLPALARRCNSWRERIQTNGRTGSEGSRWSPPSPGGMSYGRGGSCALCWPGWQPKPYRTSLW